MNYKEVIIPEKLKEYIEMHKLFYRTLGSMIFDISFIESCCDLNEKGVETDEITLHALYKDVFENLLIKVYRGFFDSGREATSLFLFKNKVLNEYISDTYKNTLITQIRLLPIENRKYRNKLENIRASVRELRNQYLAHGLIEKQSEDVVVYLADIKELVEKGCELYQVLSFDPPLDFYSWVEGGGTDFKEEFLCTRELTDHFLKCASLSSSFIKSISCEYVELCEPEEIALYSTNISSINDYKSKKSRA